MVAGGCGGELAVRIGDPVMYLGYWNDDDASRAQLRRVELRQESRSGRAPGAPQ